MDQHPIHQQLSLFGLEEALSHARTDDERRLIRAVAEFRDQEPVASYLHSALCTMSLPTRRPADEYEPIIRHDGKYSLMINPRDYPGPGGTRMRVGVPFGAKARLVLIQIMSEAVRTNSREVFLGRSLSHWMRRLGYKSFSGGPQGTMTLFREQVLRLSRCEWTIRRDGENASQLTDVRLTDDLLLWASDGGEFVESIELNPRFHEHLKEHAVPLDERALGQLKDSPTALDLYVWLVYRLPRLSRPTALTWDQVMTHFGNDYAAPRQFRHELRKLLPKVLAFYPNAKVDMAENLVRLYPSLPAVPSNKHFMRSSHLSAVPRLEEKTAKAKVAVASTTAKRGGGKRASGTKSITELFLAALAEQVDGAAMSSWFSDCEIQDTPEGMALVAPSGFAADWIRSHFRQAVDMAGKSLGLPAVEVISRKRAGAADPKTPAKGTLL